MRRALPLVFLAAVALATSASCRSDSPAPAGDPSWGQSRDLTPEHVFTAGIEGPAFDGEGFLYAVNFRSQGTIGRMAPDGTASLFLVLPEGSVGNGIRFGPSGEMYVADHTGHNVLRVGRGSSEAEVFAHVPGMNQPNDLAIDDAGNLYASDPDWKTSTGRLWRIDRTGTAVLLEDGMGTTNGIEVAPGSAFLYVNESVQRRIWRYDLSRTGEVTNKRLFHTFPDFGLDGMRCDERGNLHVARHGKGTIAIIAPDGTLAAEVRLKGTLPTNLAFGGPDGRTVAVTLADRGALESYRAPYPGREFRLWRDPATRRDVE